MRGNAEFPFRLYCLAMCGRYRLTRVDKLAERFDVEPEDDWVPRYNIAPAQNMPSSCTDAFDYVSTLDHTRASTTGSFETAGHRERSYWPLRDHKTSNLIDLTLTFTTQPTRPPNEQ
jgi:hypothetical protein